MEDKDLWRLQDMFLQLHYIENILFDYVDEKKVDKIGDKIRKDIKGYIENMNTK